jgi:hypothetical protein
MKKIYPKRKLRIAFLLMTALLFAGPASRALPTPVADPNIWLGINSTDWFDAGNWSGGVPSSSTDVIIPTIADPVIYAPMIVAGNAHVATLSLLPGASLTVKDNGILSLFGTVHNTAGIFDVTDGTLDLAAPGTELAGNAILNNTLKNLRISAGGTVSFTSGEGPVKITGTISFLSSNNTFNTNDNLVLLSSASRTAALGNLTNDGLGNALTGNSVTGKATVEKFINTPRKWQFLSPLATYDSSSVITVQQSWMEGQGAGENNGAAGYGMWLTGVGGQPGFDAATTTPTMKYWTGAAYEGIAGMSADLHAQPAYMVYVRGDRASTGSNNISNRTVLRVNGLLRQGDYPSVDTYINIPGGNDVMALGNPYASAINLNKLITTVSPTEPLTFYVWDPMLTGAFGLGGFQTLSGTTAGGFLISPGYGSYGVTPGPDVYMNTIESGQAFFIQPPENPISLRFQEAQKTAFENNVSFAPISAGQEARREEILKGVLFLQGDNDAVADGVMLRFSNSYNAAVTNADARKLVNNNENISIRNGNKLLAVEYRRPVADHDTIQLNMTGMHAAKYRWSFYTKNMAVPGRSGFLIDRYTHTETPLDLNGQTGYDFQVELNGTANAADRFLIVFRPSKTAIYAANIDQQPTAISISPNPVQDHMMNVYFTGKPNGKYRLQVTDMNGKTVLTTATEIRNSNMVKRIGLPATVVAGNYRASITDAKGKTSSVLFVVK